MGYYAKIEDNLVTDLIAADQSYLDYVGGEWHEVSEESYFQGEVQVGFIYNSETNTFQPI